MRKGIVLPNGTIMESIIAIFRMDTCICAVQGMMLEHYQMQKHGWTSDQQREYLQNYLDHTVKPYERDIELIEDTAKYVYETMMEHLTSFRDIMPELHTEEDFNNFIAKL